MAQHADQVLAALRASDPRLANVQYRKETDDVGDEWLWVEVDEEHNVFTKGELTKIAEAVRAVEPESTVWLWIKDSDDNEWGLEVFRDKITPDEYRRD